MAVDQFCLKWNNFQSSIVTAFGSLQSTEDLADVTLTCEGMSIKAHKIILSACSPYFRSVFKENPCSHPIVILKDVLHSDLIAVLNFMYHGEVLISQDKLISFLQTAEALQVSGLVATAGMQDLPLKLSTGLCRNYTRPVKSKPPEVIENAQKRIKLASKAKTKTNQPIKNSDRNIESPSIVKCTENAGLGSGTPENSSSPKLKEMQRDSLMEKMETVTVDSIKTEIDEEYHGDHNFNDKIDAYNLNDRSRSQSSILEAALEVKEQPSILERSLTSYAPKFPIMPYTLENVTVIQHSSPEPQEHILRKPDPMEIEKKLPKPAQSTTYDLTAESPQLKSTKEEDAMKNIEVNLQGLPCDISVVNVRTMQDIQPHHSSQCGNCPHCGEVYSNQSALKYHVRLVHSDLTNMYCCHLCPESFDYREGYKKHMAEAHSVRN